MSDREPGTHNRGRVGSVVAIEGVTWFPLPPQLMECESGNLGNGVKPDGGQLVDVS